MKKLVALIISASLLLTPCFAFADTASGSALTLDEQLWIMNEGGIKPIQVAAVESGAIKAVAADNTNVFLNGYSMPSSMNFYYFGSGSQATTFTNSFSQLPYLAQAITYSIAYSTQNLNTKIQTALTTLNTAVSGISTGVANINTSSGNTATNTSNIYTRLGTINSNIGNLKSYTDGVESTLTDILSAIRNQSFTVPQSLLDDVDSLATNQVTLSRISPDSSAGWADYWIRNPDQLIRRYRQTSNGGSNTDINRSITVQDPLNQIWFWLYTLNDNFVLASRDLTSGIFSNPATPTQWLDKDLNPTVLPRTSLWFDIRTLGVNMNNILARLGFVLANDDEIAARQAAAANTAAAVSNVISSSGSGSAKPTDISGIADLKSSTVDSISSGVSASTVFSQTGSGGHAWDWFTQDIADELSAPSRRSNVRSNSKSSGSDTPYLDAYYHDLEEAIGFKLPW